MTPTPTPLSPLGYCFTPRREDHAQVLNTRLDGRGAARHGTVYTQRLAWCDQV